MSKDYPMTGEEYTISLESYWWENNGCRIISGTDTMQMEYGYIEASYNSDPDLSNGDGYFDYYNQDGNLCIMDGEIVVVREVFDNGDIELQGQPNYFSEEPVFVLNSEEFAICAS